MATDDQDSALFVYGSLLDASHRRSLLGRDVETIAARLLDYERRRRRHFYLVRRAGAVTPGLVLLGLGASDFEVLDRYEELPRLYTRERAQVIDSADRTIRCWLYLPTDRLLKG